MKFRIPYKSPLLLLAVLCALSLVSCGQSAGEKTAAAIMDRVIACDAATMSVIMGHEITALSDMEQFTVRRMTYDIVGETHNEETRTDGETTTHVFPTYVTVDVHGYDLMALFNEAILYVYESANDAVRSTVATWALEKLNTGDVKTASFRAVIPLLQNPDGTWYLDATAIGDDLRDAVTGGAYSWYQAYEEVFGTTEQNTNEVTNDAA